MVHMINEREHTAINWSLIFLIVSNKSALCLLQARLAHPTSWVCCHEIYFPCSISYIICQLSWAHNFKY